MACASCYWRRELGRGRLTRPMRRQVAARVRRARETHCSGRRPGHRSQLPVRQVQFVTSSSAVPPTRLARPTGTTLSHPEHPCSGAREVATTSLDRGIPSDRDRLACRPESASRIASSLHHEQRSGSSVGAVPKTVGTEVGCRRQAAVRSGSQDRADMIALLDSSNRV
jgi:hypothetical protein